MTAALEQAVELGHLKADVRMLLKRIEWSGDDVAFICPECQESRVAGHAITCRLEAILQAVQRPETG